MKSQLFRITMSFFAAFLANAAMASEVSGDDVARAAAAFVSEDSIGSVVLRGCSVANVSQRSHLWIVALSPSGHVVMSGSDLADPIVGFSKNDFAEPDPESPAFAVLEGANASVATAEAQDGGTRHARWTKLLGGMKKSGLLRADNPSSGAVVVESFLAEHYNQWQPYNDYAPVHEPYEDMFADGYEPYRGRCPCGCVATASAQIFHHFKWPARIDNTISYGHVFQDDTGQEKSFPIRFDGHEPINWNAISNEYAYPYRSGVDETVRYPIARLILWCDVLARMEFESSGSNSSYDTIASNVLDWYTQGHWVEVGANADYSQVVSDLRAGIPLQVGLYGHQVVAHGWAQDGTSKYIYLNYGWGGSSDGYYNLDNSTIDRPIQEIFVGHYPRAKPQIDPLPKVCETNVTINWHFPDFYTNKLSGFTVSVSKTAATTSTFLDDFSATSGISDIENGSINNGDHDRIYIATDPEYGSGCGNLLYVEPLAIGHFTYADKLTLTDSSMLSFKLRSVNANACVLEIQARFNDGEWITLHTPPLSTSSGYMADSKWQSYHVDLIGHIGDTAQFRINKDFEYGNYYPSGRILLDDFSVSNVLQQEAPTTFPVDADKRSCEIIGLDAGSTYLFTVTPIMSGAIVSAEASDPAVTKTAGEILVPVEGEVTYVNINSAFPTSDDGVQWTMVGTLSGNKVTKTGAGTCSVSAQLMGTLTENSQLTFNWQGRGTYKYNNKTVQDTLTVSYIDENNSTTVLTQETNSASMRTTAWNSLVVSLGVYSGQKGTIKIELSCPTTKTSSTLTISQPQIKDISVPSGPPEITWVPQQISALGMPEIRSVSSVSEGFYGECWTNTTTFSVVCSETVEALDARPSHLSLVRDEDVSVSEMGNGKFKVCVTPSGINESNFRSRMILTLVGTDSNGTKCYKDLSLRFSQVEPKPTEVHVAATTSSGDDFSVEVPYSWIESFGLAAPNSDAAAHEAALASTADADSDGLPNWAEYVCGTSPTDPTEKLVAFITMVNGEPVVTYSPGDSRIADGFKAVIKGTTDLSAALSAWEVVTETRTSTCRFFRVEIVPEN